MIYIPTVQYVHVLHYVCTIIQNIYKMLEAIKLNKYLLKGLDGKFKFYENNITEASPGS